MAMMLERLLRIRSLLEEAGRADLERQINHARRAEDATRRTAKAAREAHLASVAPWLDAPVSPITYPAETSHENETRRLAEAECEAGVAQTRDLRRLADQEARRALVLRDAYLGLRKERQQVEILLEEAALRRSFTEARREQRELDDWFAFSALRARRARAASDKA